MAFRSPTDVLNGHQTPTIAPNTCRCCKRSGGTRQPTRRSGGVLGVMITDTVEMAVNSFKLARGSNFPRHCQRKWTPAWHHVTTGCPFSVGPGLGWHLDHGKSTKRAFPDASPKQNRPRRNRRFVPNAAGWFPFCKNRAPLSAEKSKLIFGRMGRNLLNSAQIQRPNHRSPPSPVPIPTRRCPVPVRRHRPGCLIDVGGGSPRGHSCATMAGNRIVVWCVNAVSQLGTIVRPIIMQDSGGFVNVFRVLHVVCFRTRCPQ
jgi:hypothetical protein